MADTEKQPPLCRDVAKLAPIMQQALVAFGAKWVFGVAETLRTPERQEWLVARKKSKTMKSRHLKGMAADLFPKPLAYDAPPETWHEMHNDWDAIVKQLGREPEPRISWDLGHFAILGEP